MSRAKEFEDALRDEFPRAEVAEFQVFLSFRNDDDGISFREWWQGAGAAAFAQWLTRHKDAK